MPTDIRVSGNIEELVSKCEHLQGDDIETKRMAFTRNFTNILDLYGEEFMDKFKHKLKDMTPEQMNTVRLNNYTVE